MITNGTQSEILVEARGIERTFETGDVKVRALRGVDLALARGEMVADDGPERLRQDDAPQLPLGPRARSIAARC